MKIKKVRREQETKFEEGIKRTIDWYLENKEWMEKVITALTKRKVYQK